MMPSLKNHKLHPKDYKINLSNHVQYRNLLRLKWKQKKLQNKKLKVRSKQLQTQPPLQPRFLFSQLDQNYSGLNLKILKQPTRQPTSQSNSFLFSQRKILILIINKPLFSHKPVIPTSQTSSQKQALLQPNSNLKPALCSLKLTLLNQWSFSTTIAPLLSLLIPRLSSRMLRQSFRIMKLLRERRMKFPFIETVWSFLDLETTSGKKEELVTLDLCVTKPPKKLDLWCDKRLLLSR